MLEGKVGVVLSSTGEAGKRAVADLLNGGASKVVVVAETEDKKKELLDKFPNEAKEGRLQGVIGKYKSKKNMEEILQKVKEVLGPNQDIHHIVSSISQSSYTKEEKLGDSDRMKEFFDHSFFPNMFAAEVFLPPLRAVPNSSFTIFDDPFVPFSGMRPLYWPSLINDAATNTFFDILSNDYPTTRLSVRRLLRET